MSKILALLIIVFVYLADASALFAYDVPNFTSCVNPMGEIKASYDSGSHGIAGKPGSFEGKDVVYKLSDNALTQCFCAVNGNGIRTNWWKIPSISGSEIKTLEAQGWIYIPNGALWGLDKAPYMAKNSDFSCKSSGGNGGNDSSSGSSSSNNSSGDSAGSVVASSAGGIGQVLGLASTGNSVFLLATALTSGISLLTGLILKKRSSKVSR